MKTFKNLWFWVSVLIFTGTVAIYFNLSSQLEALRKNESRRKQEVAQAQQEPNFAWLEGGKGLRITFKRAMVDRSAVGKFAALDTAKLTQHGKVLPLFWTGTRALVYKASGRYRIKPTRKYELTFGPGLTCLDGTGYRGPRKFILKTDEFALLDAYQSSANRKLNTAEVTLLFNAPCSATGLKKYLITAAGVNCRVKSNGYSTRHKLKLEAVKEGMTLDIGIAAGMPSKNPDFKLVNPVTRRIMLKNRELAITALTAKREFFCGRGLRMELNDRVDRDELSKYLAITPSVNWKIARQTGNGIYISGDFRGDVNYTVTLKKGLASNGCNPLKSEVSWTVRFPGLSTSVNFVDADKLFLRTGGGMLVPVRTAAVEQLEVRVCRIYPNNTVWYLNDWGNRGYKYGKEVFSHTFTIKDVPDQAVVSYLDLRRVLKYPEPGVYEIYAKVAGNWHGEHRRIILTNLGVTAKRAGEQFFVYVNKIDNSSPVDGADVQIFTARNQLLAQGKSSKGRLVMDARKVESGDLPLTVRATKGKDVCELKLSGNQLATTGFKVEGMQNPRQGYEAFVYAPRDLYRPGETLNLFTIVRGIGVKAPGRFPVVMTVRRPDGVVFKKITAELKDDGSCEAVCKLPFSARTGWYHCSVSLPGQHGSVLGRYKFLVDEFTPDKMKVTLSIPERDYKPEEPLRIKAVGEYLFGAPVAGGKAVLKVSCFETDFSADAYPGYSFRVSTPVKSVITGCRLASASLGAGGEVLFSTSAPDWKARSNYRALYMVTVNSPSGGSSSGYKSVPVIKYPTLAGIKYLGSKRPEPGDTLQFGCVLLDARTKQRRESSLQLTVKRINYCWERQLKNGMVNYRRIEEITTVDNRTLAAGCGEFFFRPKQQGKFVFIVHDPASGHKADVELNCYRSYYDYLYNSHSGKNNNLQRIAIKFDKTEYKHGDTMQLQLQTPVMGHGYITIESNSVLDFYPFFADKPIVNLSIPVKLDYPFSFNVFAAVSRDSRLKSDFPWDFACGYVPVRLNHDSRTLNVQIEAPEKSLPGAETELKISVADTDGKPHASSLTLAMVDEGVCRLTAFKTPSPLDYFYAKRRLSVDTFSVYLGLMEDLTVGQVNQDNILYGGGGVLGRMLRIARPEERKVAQIWRSDIKTGSDGIARIKVKLPRFTGKLRVMAVAFAGPCFGSGTAYVKVADPLTTLTNFPTFLAPGDQATAPVTIFNNTGKKADVNLRIADDKYSLALGQGESRTVYQRIVAPSYPGKLRFDLYAALLNGGKLWKREIPVLVRSSHPPRVESVSGAFPASVGKRSISIPGKWLKNSAQGTLTVSSAPGLELGDCLDYLVRYPYGCLEQTTSAAFCVLQAPELYQKMSPQMRNTAQIKTYLQVGVDRILSMQLYNGGFAMWPRGRDDWEWGSIYAADFLLEAKKYGCQVPDNAVERMGEYLRGMRGHLDSELSAYALYVLSRAGKLKKSEMPGSPASIDNNTVSGLYAMALLNVGLRKAALKVVDAHIKPTRAARFITGGSLSSSIRDDAVALMVLLKMKPDSPEIVELVKRLSKYCRGRRYTTQDAAWALRALALYNKTIASSPINFKTEIWQNGKVLASFSSADAKNFVTVPVKADAGASLELRSRGRGRIYYRLAVAGIPAEAPVEKDRGIVVRRTILKTDGSKADLQDIRVGELYVVKITLSCRGQLDNLVINDLLPGCFTVENANLATRDNAAADRFKNTLKPVRVDPRFDRYLIFCDSQYSIVNPVRTFYYAVRAAYKGSFKLPAVFGTCMYDPDIYSCSSSGRIIVK